MRVLLYCREAAEVGGGGFCDRIVTVGVDPISLQRGHLIGARIRMTSRHKQRTRLRCSCRRLPDLWSKRDWCQSSGGSPAGANMLRRQPDETPSPAVWRLPALPHPQRPSDQPDAASAKKHNLQYAMPGIRGEPAGGFHAPPEGAVA